MRSERPRATLERGAVPECLAPDPLLRLKRFLDGWFIFRLRDSNTGRYEHPGCAGFRG